jgi:WD40 repeat protein
MSLQSGLGDVIEKNILIQNSLTEKLTAVTTYDNSKIWIVTHDWGSNGFYAYQLTGNGFEMNPVISNSGIVHTTTAIQNTYGQMKFASCGGRLALAAGYLDTIELFDFNLTTGTISNPMTIPMEDHVYGLEFSPDDSKLYVTCYNPLGTLVQFDLTQGNVEAIINSATMLSNTEDLYGLQLAPDGKIYVVKSYSPNLAVINEPNVAGNDCNFVENGINLDPTYSGASAALGLPNFVQSYFDYAHKGCTFPTTIYEMNTMDEISFFPNPATGFVSFSTTALKGKPVEIYVSDLAGKSCIQYKMDTYVESIRIDLSTVEQGIYIIRINQGEMVIAREMLVITHL